MSAGLSRLSGHFQAVPAALCRAFRTQRAVIPHNRLAAFVPVEGAVMQWQVLISAFGLLSCRGQVFLPPTPTHALGHFQATPNIWCQSALAFTALKCPQHLMGSGRRGYTARDTSMATGLPTGGAGLLLLDNANIHQHPVARALLLFRHQRNYWLCGAIKPWLADYS